MPKEKASAKASAAAATAKKIVGRGPLRPLRLILIHPVQNPIPRIRSAQITLAARETFTNPEAAVRSAASVQMTRFVSWPSESHALRARPVTSGRTRLINAPAFAW